MNNRVFINRPIISTKQKDDVPSLLVDGIDVAKELIFLRKQNEIFKRVLLVKNICTEEEIDDIINSFDVEERLIEGNKK